MTVLRAGTALAALAMLLCGVGACTPADPPPRPKPAARVAPRTITLHPTAPSTLLAPTTGLYSSRGCGRAVGSIVTVVVMPDGVLPSCLEVTSGQRFRVVDRMDPAAPGRARVVVLDLPGSRPVALAPGDSLLYDLPFGAFLAKGQHRFAGLTDFWLTR